LLNKLRFEIRTGADRSPEEEFSWENDEEDETASPTPAASSTLQGIASSMATSGSLVSVSEETEAWSPTESRSGDISSYPAFSARNSSEEGTASSYDVVTGPSSRVETENEAEVTTGARVKPVKTVHDSDDSDWE
jgi:hypothetical protein